MIDIYTTDITDLWIQLSCHMSTRKKFYRYSLKDKKQYELFVTFAH